jgi:hypothetical protein
MNRAFTFLIVFVAALGAATGAHATSAVGPMLSSMERLLVAEARGFTGQSRDEVRALRKEFSDRVAAARSAAKAEYGRLAAGKSAQEIDRLLAQRAAQSGIPAEVRQYVDAAGGPAKTMLQLDRLADEFAADVLAGSRSYARGPLERMIAGWVGAAQARLLRRACYLAVYSLTVAGGTAGNYDGCNRTR